MNRPGPPAPSTHDLQDQIRNLQKEVIRTYKHIAELEAKHVQLHQYMLKSEKLAKEHIAKVEKEMNTRTEELRWILDGTIIRGRMKGMGQGGQ